jgi:hypothetical protein
MAIMAEVEERLLRTDSFEDIITCLKSDPAQWSDDKLRGLLTAAYLSSVSETELRLASESVASVGAVSHSRRSSRAAGRAGESASGEQSEQGEADGGGVSEATPDASPDAVGVGRASTIQADDKRSSIANLDKFEDIMKQELQHLTWAGPSASSGPAGPSTSGGPSALGDAVLDPKSVLHLSAGDIGGPSRDANRPGKLQSARPSCLSASHPAVAATKVASGAHPPAPQAVPEAPVPSALQDDQAGSEHTDHDAAMAATST